MHDEKALSPATTSWGKGENNANRYFQRQYYYTDPTCHFTI
jgi:hypothetical protein